MKLEYRVSFKSVFINEISSVFLTYMESSLGSRPHRICMFIVSDLQTYCRSKYYIVFFLLKLEMLSVRYLVLTE